ncbi:MAG: acetylxylan esterase [Armatimonadetes bacterium]|nr:acetylxylan esterase [Armatimonadota bacterium]
MDEPDVVRSVDDGRAKAESKADHRRLLNALGISSLRPGRHCGDSADPGYFNTDESAANPYPHIPKLLKFENGESVSTPEDWQRRRKEILALLDQEIYGETPEGIPRLEWRVRSSGEYRVVDRPVSVQELRGVADNHRCPEVQVEIAATLILPIDADQPMPVLMEFAFPAFEDKSWHLLALDRGWGICILDPLSIQPDSGAGLREGIIGLANGGNPRQPEQWGVLKAWAWGAGRLRDYLSSVPEVDGNKIALAGLSRFGKATAVAMAYEPGFAAVLIGSSGQAGVKIWRRNFGEPVENIADPTEYHWVAGRYLRYAGPLSPGDMPVDGHQLLALAAPKPMMVGIGSQTVAEQWADVRGTFMAVSEASPAWAIQGAGTIWDDQIPSVGQPKVDSNLVFYLHEYGHTNAPNWPVFIEFLGQKFSGE